MSTAPQNGRVAVVTGGSRGIGLAIAEALLTAGAAVVISGRDQSHLDAAVKHLSSTSADAGSRIHAVQADVGKPDEAGRTIDAAFERFGGLDILINNAGVGLFANVADMDVDAWQEVIDTNLSGVFYCCHAAIPRLRQRGGGWIINISSLAGKNSLVSGAAYCASKAGLNAFSESLMQEVRYDNIRVSYVMPGSVATAFGGQGAVAAGIARPGEDWKIAPEDVAQVVMDLIAQPARTLASRVEIRPSKPGK
jgi:3-oxoacyl-[acyl-carrier protein] reductase